MIHHPRSTTKSYDVAGFIGRLQGLQDGHGDNIEACLDKAEIALVMPGSVNVARDTRNPFNYEERLAVLQAYVARRFPTDRDRVRYAPLNDYPYDKKAWIDQVNSALRGATSALRPRIALVGNIRDATSEYLTWFSAYPYIPVKDSGSNATAIRKAFFSGNVDFDAKGWNDTFDWSTVPVETVEFMRKFRDRPVYGYLMKQLAAETAYREKWGPGPFQTVDGVVRYGDHVLMIERGGEEGTGMRGLPGGFLNPFETLLWGAAREVVEETALFISDDDLPAFRNYLAACHAAQMSKAPPPAMPDFMTVAIRTLISYVRGGGKRFDDPNRSRRGHLITESFLFELPVGLGFPRVVGMDDAKAAFWMPSSDIRPEETFEDHAHIIDFMLTHFATY